MNFKVPKLVLVKSIKMNDNKLIGVNLFLCWMDERPLVYDNSLSLEKPIGRVKIRNQMTYLWAYTR